MSDRLTLTHEDLRVACAVTFLNSHPELYLWASQAVNQEVGHEGDFLLTAIAVRKDGRVRVGYKLILPETHVLPPDERECVFHPFAGEREARAYLAAKEREARKRQQFLKAFAASVPKLGRERK
jgi:hypothetical protein